MHVHMVQKLYRSGTGKRYSDLPYDTEALREYGGICLRKKTANAESLSESHQKQAETKLQIPGETDFCGEKKSQQGFFLIQVRRFWKKSIRNGLIVIK